MANKWWVGGSGTWNGSSTTHWSDSDGGASGAVAPTSSDDVIVNTNSGNGTITIASGSVCNNCTINWTAIKTNTISLSANFSPGGTLTINGNSAINRILVKSSTLGTTRTVTVSAVSLSNVDFQDITGAGAAADFTGTSLGNALGNSGISFTAPVTRYWVDTDGGSWSATMSWSGTSGGSSGASVPLPQDTVIFDANSITSGGRTITEDMPRLGTNISFNGILNSPTLAKGSVNSVIYGNFTLESGMSMSGSSSFFFEGRSTHTITSNGVTWTAYPTINSYGGTYSLGSNFSGNTFRISQSGNVDFNDKNVTLTNGLEYNSSSSGNLYLGSGTITLSGTGFVYSGSNHGGTIFPETSTLLITDTSSTEKQFASSFDSFNIITITGDNVVLPTNDCAITTLNLNNAGLTNGTKITEGTTVTITNFNTNGSAGNLVKLSSDTGGLPHYLEKSDTNDVNEDYMSIQDSEASPADTWYAGANSTNVSGNTGWIFEQATTTSTSTTSSSTSTTSSSTSSTSSSSSSSSSTSTSTTSTSTSSTSSSSSTSTTSTSTTSTSTTSSSSSTSSTSSSSSSSTSSTSSSSSTSTTSTSTTSTSTTITSTSTSTTSTSTTSTSTTSSSSTSLTFSSTSTTSTSSSTSTTSTSTTSSSSTSTSTSSTSTSTTSTSSSSSSSSSSTIFYKRPISEVIRDELSIGVYKR